MNDNIRHLLTRIIFACQRLEEDFSGADLDLIASDAKALEYLARTLAILALSAAHPHREASPRDAGPATPDGRLIAKLYR